MSEATARTGEHAGGGASARDGLVAAPAARLPSLDVLRGVAICWVIAFHLSVNVAGFHPLDNRYRDVGEEARSGRLFGVASSSWHLILSLGYQGVPLFMMLSGFTLTYGILRSHRPASLGSFYRRRIATLMTPYWLAFALTMLAVLALAFARSLVQEHVFSTELTDMTKTGQATYPVHWPIVLAGAAFVPRGLSDAWINAPSPSLWFVFLLVQFYALFPALFWLLQRIGPWAFAVLAFVITIGSKLPFAVSHNGNGLLLNWWVDAQYLPFNLLTFALGMSIAWLFVHDRASLRRYTSGRIDSLLLVYAGLVLQTAGTLAEGRTGFVGVFAGPMVVLGLTLIVLPWIANASSGRSSSAALAALAAAGAMSYSILIASDPLQYAVGTMYALDAATWIWVIFWLAYAPLLLAMASCVERTSRALVSRVAGRRTLTPTTEVAALSSRSTLA